MIVGSRELDRIEDWSISLTFLETIVKVIGASPCRALDVGCGTGEMAQYLAVLSGARVTGIERSAWAAERASRRIECHHVSTEGIPDHLEDFDLIYCKDLLPSIEGKEAFFSQVKAHLRADGVFMTYLSRAEDFREKPLYRYVEGARRRARERKSLPGVVAGLLRRSGFRSVSFRRLFLGEIPIDMDYARKHADGIFSNSEDQELEERRRAGMSRLRRDVAALCHAGSLLSYRWERTLVVAR